MVSDSEISSDLEHSAATHHYRQHAHSFGALTSDIPRRFVSLRRRRHHASEEAFPKPAFESSRTSIEIPEIFRWREDDFWSGGNINPPETPCKTKHADVPGHIRWEESDFWTYVHSPAASSSGRKIGKVLRKVSEVFSYDGGIISKLNQQLGADPSPGLLGMGHVKGQSQADNFVDKKIVGRRNKLRKQPRQGKNPPAK